MEKELLKIVATRVTGNHAGILVKADCTGDELTQILANVIIQISDTNQSYFKVQNGYWLVLNDTVNEILKKRSLKR